MKRLLFALVCVSATAAFADAPDGGTRGPGRGPPRGPPPQAVFDACSGKSADAACSFTIDGRTENGTCRAPPHGGQLGCMPAHGPGGPGGHRGPPPEAKQACSGLQAKAACAFTGRGQNLVGTCENAPDGTLACRPEGMPPPPGGEGAR